MNNIPNQFRLLHLFVKRWYLVKGHGPSGCSDVDDVIGLLESIADDGKVAIQSNDVDSTIEMLAFAREIC